MIIRDLVFVQVYYDEADIAVNSLDVREDRHVGIFKTFFGSTKLALFKFLNFYIYTDLSGTTTTTTTTFRPTNPIG